MLIPQNSNLSTITLGNVFKSTTATYKFFWLISILQIHSTTNRLHISVWDIVIRMVANAWYPIHYFRLSFGKGDSLFQIVMELQAYTQIPVDADVDAVVEGLKKRINDTTVRKLLRTLTINVPYRFLSPWISYKSDKESIIRSQNFENECLYSLEKTTDDFYINLNSNWDDYLHEHYQVLMDFTYWNLMQFLQVRNPNVPAISNKLIRPNVRASLQKQHTYWNKVIDICGPIHCIYTGAEIQKSDYALDHFVPWSFVTHDLLWNLIPADNSINSSKSDKLPDLEVYLPKLANLQHHSLQALAEKNITLSVMEDYTSLGYSTSELVNMSDETFMDIYQRTFNPIIQIAQNMGFEKWEY